MRLNPATPGVNGTVYYSGKQSLLGGFDTQFQFQISGTGGPPDALGNSGGDGFAFIIQHQGATFTGPRVGYIPFSIPDCLVIKFDTWENDNLGDPNGNYISIQAIGAAPDGVSEFMFDPSLGFADTVPNISDGNIHQARILYVPGVMAVYLDDLNTPVAVANIDLDSINGSSTLDSNGKAWVGFAGGAGAAFENHDILSWSFTPIPAINSSAEDILFYGVAKDRLFVQTNSGTPVLDVNPFALYLFVADRNVEGNILHGASVDTLNGPVVLVPQSTQRRTSAQVDLEVLISYPTQALLDGDFPDGDFTFNFDTPNNGLFSSTLTLSGNSYPAAPHISNFTAAQSLDPAADFVLTWDAFAGGTSNSLIRLSIYDGTNLVFDTGMAIGDFASLDGRARSILIPAYTLPGSRTCDAFLAFAKGSRFDPCSCGKPFAGVQTTTKFTLHTTALRRSPSDVFPIAVTGINEIAYDMAYGGGNYLVAMLGRQNIDLNSPEHGEVVAVLVGRDGTVKRVNATGHFSGNTAVAFGGQKFLMVWEDEQNILGQFISTNGDFIEMPFPISNDPFGTEQPDVTSDGTNFLVTWTASDGNEYTLPRAQLIGPDGMFLGGEIALASGAENVEVGAGGGRFLAIAQDSDTGSGVYGQLLDSNGNLIGSPIDIDTTPYRSSGPKTVFFDEMAQRFIVTFQDGTAQDPHSKTESDLYARTVSLNGTVGSRETIASGSGFQGAAKIASDGHSLLITWVDGIFSSAGKSHAQFFDSNLNALSADMITFVQHSNKVPFIAPVQFDGSRFLIVNSVLQVTIDPVDGDNEFFNGDLYGRFIMPNAPGIATQPRGQTVAPGANVTFSVQATGPQPLTYQWQRNGANISGATTAQLTLNNVSPVNAGAYRVLISNSSGTTISSAAQLTVLQPPTIVQQPESSLSVGFNQDITFSVVAGGDAPLTYQWHLNGINIPGATESSLTVSSAIEAQGSYSVTVANPVGATNSAEASLTLQGPALDFKDNFAERNILEGGNAISGFGGGTNTGATKELGEPAHAGKTGGASVWYGWRAPDNGVVTFSTAGSGFDTLLAVYTGASVDQLTLVVADDDSGPAFSSRVTFNAVSNVEYIVAVDGLGGRSGRIFLAWNFQFSAASAPVIVASAVSQTAAAGSTVSLQVAVQSDSAAEFQWFKDGVLLIDRTSNPLVIDSFQQSDIGSYVVRVRNASAFEVFSAPAFVELGASPALTTDDKFEDARLNRIIVGGALARSTGGTLPAAFAAPSAGSIVTHNYSSTKESGEPNHGGVSGGASRWFVLRLNASGLLAIDTIGSDFDTVLAVYTGTSLVALQLVAQDNDSALDGVRSMVRFDASAGVDYYVAVDGVNGAQGNIALNYHFGTPPQIVQPPAATSAIIGSDFSLHVVAAAAPDLSYLWKLNGVPIPGATNAELLVAKCQLLDQGTYTIEVSNPLGATASAVNVSVLDAGTKPTVVLTSPSATAFLVNPTNVQVSADASGYALTKVEFFVNKKKIGEATAAPYTANWSVIKAGKYTLTAKVTDGSRRTAVSAPVKLSVLQPVTIIRQPLPRSVALGKTARFKVTAKGSAPVSYQWFFEDTEIVGAIKSSLPVTNVQTNALGNYSVRITNPAGSLISSAAALTLKP